MRDTIRKHVYWMHEAVERRYTKIHGQAAANKNYKDIRLEAMRSVAYILATISERMRCIADKDGMEF